MKFLKYFESLSEMDEFKDLIKMIFVDLIDDRFTIQLLPFQRVEGTAEQQPIQVRATDYNKCNVIYIRLVRFNESEEHGAATYHSDLEIYKHKIIDCYKTLFSFLDKKWNGAKLEKVIREDENERDDVYFSSLDDEDIWVDDIYAISITVIKNNLVKRALKQSDVRL